MRGPQSPFANFAEHLRKFKQARLTIELLDARQRATFIHQFLHLIMLVAEDRKLREVSHTKDLV